MSQALVIFEYFAIHSCEDKLFITALDIHRKLVDAARQYQLLQDSVMPIADAASVDASSLERDWYCAMRSESRKRCVYICPGKLRC